LEDGIPGFDSIAIYYTNGKFCELEGAEAMDRTRDGEVDKMKAYSELLGLIAQARRVVQELATDCDEWYKEYAEAHLAELKNTLERGRARFRKS